MFQPQKLYYKKRRQQLSERNVQCKPEDLKKEWDSLDKESKSQYEVRSNALIARGPFLSQELTDILKRTNGFMTWRQIQELLGTDVCSHKTTRKHVMNISTFCYTVNRVFLSLMSLQRKGG